LTKGGPVVKSGKGEKGKIKNGDRVVFIGVAQSNFPVGARRAVPKVQGHSTLCPYVKKQSEKPFGNRYKSFPFIKGGPDA